jgi:hypothetical protein
MNINQVQKNFNMMLQNENVCTDVLPYIDQLYKSANVLLIKDNNIGAINMLRNFIISNLPDMHNVFSLYAITHCSIDIDSETGYISSNSNKKATEFAPSFLLWLKSNEEAHKLFPAWSIIDIKGVPLGVASTNRILDSKQVYKIGQPNKITKKPCPYCGEKFKSNSNKSIETHTCRTVKTANSIWTISGGGGPGTGKRS